MENVRCKYCIVPNCKTTSVSAPEKIFLTVPKGIELREKWCEAIGRHKKSYSCKSYLTICEDHFDLANDTENYTEYNLMHSQKQKVKLRLKKDVLPHIFDRTTEDEMAVPNNDMLLISIKEETENDMSGVQIENEFQNTEAQSLQMDYAPENPFENLRLEIKQESENLKFGSQNITQRNIEEHVKNLLNDVAKITEENIEIKEELQVEENIVSYDYPNFEDDGSINSTEGTAFGNVEACLQDEINIKSESDSNYHENKGESNTTEVKVEDDPTVADAHMIADSVGTLTASDAMTGLSKDNLVAINMSFKSEFSNEDIPLPLQNGEDDNNEKESMLTEVSYVEEQINEEFQLNSITGNILSLEQEAYGLIEPKQTSMEKTHACPKCSKLFLRPYGLTKHLRVHESIERFRNGFLRGIETKKKNKAIKENSKKEKEDTNTNERVDSPKDNNIKGEGYKCTCGKVYRRRIRMENCLRKHDFFSEYKSNCVPCVSCSKKFESKEALASHRKRVHSKRFPCKFCPTDYTTRKELFRHLQLHQKVQLTEYKVISEVMKGNKKIRCFMCSKSWTELSELKTHVLNAHKGPYICPHCKNTFPQIIDFGNHMKTYHPEVEGKSVLDVLEAFSKLVESWKCEECGQQFLEADKFALHQVDEHSPELKTETQIQCEDCRRVFISQKGLTSHRRIHHPAEAPVEIFDQQVMCLECRKICKDMVALASHTRFHSMERKYPCKFCDFRFATPEKRKAHAEIHTGDMKFVCFICEYQCSSENRLKKHKMTLKHANMKEYLLTGKPLIAEPSNSEQDKIKMVLKDEEWSIEKKNVAEDIEISEASSSDTEDTEEATCDVCGENFQSKNEMLDHKQTHPFIEFPNDDKPSRIFFK